ncbi:hypothetical protein [Bacillus sp. FJAT-22090]|uniref:hypothetical protein n=1 Tax=Bacillus sp. FJAT-22090 TaxID=1581038 RepID=UPI0011A445DB|nr:hypothetical protein [Bacillus sp. FJAT-22090]
MPAPRRRSHPSFRSRLAFSNEKVSTDITSTTNKVVTNIVINQSVKNREYIDYPETSEEKETYKHLFMPDDAIFEYAEVYKHDSIPKYGDIYTSQ